MAEHRIATQTVEISDPQTSDSTTLPPRLLEVKNGKELPLTTWKEIAFYVGKGVRTVQRWSVERGFPVRRPSRNVVIAIPAEIDAWLRGTMQLVNDDDESDVAQALIEIEMHRKRIAELLAALGIAGGEEGWRFLRSTNKRDRSKH